MAEIRQTRYVCDSCGRDVERKKDLRRFAFQPAGDWSHVVTFDACDTCEAELLVAMERYVPDRAREDLAAQARKPAKA